MIALRSLWPYKGLWPHSGYMHAYHLHSSGSRRRGVLHMFFFQNFPSFCNLRQIFRTLKDCRRDVGPPRHFSAVVQSSENLLVIPRHGNPENSTPPHVQNPALPTTLRVANCDVPYPLRLARALLSIGCWRSYFMLSTRYLIMGHSRPSSEMTYHHPRRSASARGIRRSGGLHTGRRPSRSD